MSEITLFECDVTGERYGAKNDVYEYEIRQHRAQSDFEVITRTIHIGIEAFDDLDITHIPSSGRTEYIGVKDGEVAGIAMEFGPSMVQAEVVKWKSRDDVVIDHYEPFFQFLEEEVLY